MNAIKAKTCVL